MMAQGRLRAVQTRLLYIVTLTVILSISSCSSDNLPEGVDMYEPEITFIAVDWSPDSSRLVGASPVKSDGINLFDRTSSEIYVWDIQADLYTQISDPEFTVWNSNPSWNPQSEQILFYSQTEFDNVYKIGMIELDSGLTRGITTFSGFTDWLNGEKFVIGSLNELFIVNTDTKNYEPVWTLPIKKQISGLSVSPDGNSIAVLIKPLGISDELTQLWILDLNTQHTSKLFENQVLENVEWSPDGEWLTLLHSEYYGSVIAIRSDGTCKTKPFAIDKTFVDFSWAPNGHSIAAVVYGEGEEKILIIDTNSRTIQNWLSHQNCLPI